MEWKSNYVSMSDYIGANEAVKKSEIPEIPAIYQWILDFGSGSQSADDWRAFLTGLKSLEGPKLFADDISHMELVGRVSHQAFAPDFEEDLVAILSEGGDLGRWAGSVLCMMQRPLYVGITTNLSDRVYKHLFQDEGLADDLGSMFPIANCALVYLELPDELLAAIYAEAEEEAGPGEVDEPSGASRLDPPRELRVVEYAAIRTAMPIFNSVKRKQK